MRNDPRGEHGGVRRLEQWPQLARQQMVPQMDHAEARLEALRGALAVISQEAGVEHESVDAARRGAHAVGKGDDAVEVGQVELVESSRARRSA